MPRAIIISICLFLCTHGYSAIITFSAELDSVSDFTFYTLPDATAPDPLFAMADLGGMPTNAMHFRTLISGPGAAAYAIESSAIYTPSVTGPINGIDWSLEINRIQTSLSDDDTPLLPLLSQSGALYTYVGNAVIGGGSTSSFREIVEDETFDPVSLASLTNLDFLEYDQAVATPPFTTIAGSHPDFTIAGGPITFGYFAMSATGSTTLLRRTGLRNGLINVDHAAVPEPSTLALFILILFGSASLRYQNSKKVKQD